MVRVCLKEGPAFFRSWEPDVEKKDKKKVRRAITKKERKSPTVEEDESDESYVRCERPILQYYVQKGNIFWEQKYVVCWAVACAFLVLAFFYVFCF